MSRQRISTTVDTKLWAAARQAAGGPTDSAVVEAALTALLREHRSAEIDEAYRAAYDRKPEGSPDAWGDLSRFLDAARA